MIESSSPEREHEPSSKNEEASTVRIQIFMHVMRPSCLCVPAVRAVNSETQIVCWFSQHVSEPTILRLVHRRTAPRRSNRSPEPEHEPSSENTEA